MGAARHTEVKDSKSVRQMDTSPRLSDFSIDYILSPKGAGGRSDRCVQESHRSVNQFDWLQCTRYRPPKLQRTRKKEGRQRRKPGRNPRIPFTGTQVAVLEDRFRLGHYLSSAEVERLSTLLCLSETRVKIWFQNRRARERRERESHTSVEVNRSEERRPGSKPEDSSLLFSYVPLENEGGPKRQTSSLPPSVRSAFSPCQPSLAKTLFDLTAKRLT